VGKKHSSIGELNTGGDEREGRRKNWVQEDKALGPTGLALPLTPNRSRHFRSVVEEGVESKDGKDRGLEESGAIRRKDSG